MAGYLAEIKVPEGETVDVGTVLAVVSDASPAGDAAPRPRSSRRPPHLPRPPPTASATGAAPLPHLPLPRRTASARAAPAPPRWPRHHPRPRRPPRPWVRAPRGWLSPVVRRLMSEHGLDPGTIRGTGGGGRITRSDVQRVIESGAVPAAPCGCGTRATGGAHPPHRLRRHGREAQQHPPHHRRAHGAVEGHLTAHDDGGRGRLRERRARAARPPRRVQGSRGVLAHLSAVHLARGHRRPRATTRTSTRRSARTSSSCTTT